MQGPCQIAQSLAAIATALEDTTWESIEVEPGGDWEKADIVLAGPNSRWLIQVKVLNKNKVLGFPR